MPRIFGPEDDWGAWTPRPESREYRYRGRGRRNQNYNDGPKTFFEYTGIGVVGGALIGSAFQTYDHGMWDADPRFMVGGMIVGGLIGAIAWAVRRR